MGLALLKCCRNPPVNPPVVAPAELVAKAARARMMSCLECGHPFTLLRRKRRCEVCSGQYCSGCVDANVDQRGFACRLCRLFPTDLGGERQVGDFNLEFVRSDLMRRRVRQLRYFLAVKRVSTEACTEKKELVDLILALHRRQHAQTVILPVDASVTRERSGPDDAVHAVAVPEEPKDVTDVPRPQINFVDMDIHSLSVRQLKEALARNFVTYRGCCEKTELVERAEKLQQEMRKNNGQAEKGVPEEVLCKVCMNAVVDCVLLECGHMLVCTACGKNLSECPVCRQYVVRVVHIFRS